MGTDREVLEEVAELRAGTRAAVEDNPEATAGG